MIGGPRRAGRRYDGAARAPAPTREVSSGGSVRGVRGVRRTRAGGARRPRQVTPDELLEAAIERVEARNGAVNAVVCRRYDQRPRRAIAAGLPDGPFKGVRYLLKDLGGWLAGDRVTRGSRFFADTPPVAAEQRAGRGG